MGNAITKLTIKDYKSIRSLENFELRNINILIGLDLCILMSGLGNWKGLGNNYRYAKSSDI
jgi:hypothetical protein